MKVGSLIECKGNIEVTNPDHIALGIKAPVEGQCYTVRNIKVTPSPIGFDACKIYIVVEEITNPIIKCSCGSPDCENNDDEPYFDIRFFEELPFVDLKNLL